MPITHHSRTRFAPSPTGHLHLGHLAHLVYLFGLASEHKAKVILRFEDHDEQRCHQDFVTSIFEQGCNLRFWSPQTPYLLQSPRKAHYQVRCLQLLAQKHAFACTCTRAQLGGHSRYPGTCAHGKHIYDPHSMAATIRLNDPSVGFPLLWDRHNQPSYLLAVVIDDLEQGIDLIIRGSDIAPFTPAQIALRRILAPKAPAPTFIHHALVLDQDSGRKLSKRTRATSLEELALSENLYAALFRAMGVTTPAPNHWQQVYPILKANS